MGFSVKSAFKKVKKAAKVTANPVNLFTRTGEVSKAVRAVAGPTEKTGPLAHFNPVDGSKNLAAAAGHQMRTPIKAVRGGGVKALMEEPLKANWHFTRQNPGMGATASTLQDRWGINMRGASTKIAAGAGVGVGAIFGRWAGTIAGGATGWGLTSQFGRETDYKQAYRGAVVGAAAGYAAGAAHDAATSQAVLEGPTPGGGNLSDGGNVLTAAGESLSSSLDAAQGAADAYTAGAQYLGGRGAALPAAPPSVADASAPSSSPLPLLLPLGLLAGAFLFA